MAAAIVWAMTMASRSTVSSLLTEMAVKLSGQWDDASPGAAASRAADPDEDGAQSDEG